VLLPRIRGTAAGIGLWGQFRSGVDGRLWRAVANDKGSPGRCRARHLMAANGLLLSRWSTHSQLGRTRSNINKMCLSKRSAKRRVSKAAVLRTGVQYCLGSPHRFRHVWVRALRS
jgi:hypothetical protein